MELSIDKKSFLSEISKVIGVIEKKTTMPILSNILLKTKDGLLIIIGTDLEVTIITYIKCSVKEEGEVAVPAKKLYDYVRELPDSDINIKKEGGFINIVVGKISGKLKILQSEDFPQVEEYKNNYTTVSYEKMIEMIDKTIYATSVDEVRYSLNGVYLEKLPDGLRCVATDSHRLALYNYNEINSIEGLTRGIIIPRKGLYEIKKISGTDEVKIAIEKNKNFIVKIGDTTIQIRLLEYDFPDYKSIIPAETKINIKIKKVALIAAIKRAQSIYQDKISMVIFNIDKDILTIESNEPDVGEVKEELEIDYKGNPIKTGFNGRYLLDCLNAIDGEFILIGLNNEQGVSIFTADGDKNHINLIMPMRT